MKIQSLSIQNFRSIREAEVNIHDEVTACVGRNGVGKSTVLHALRYFFNQNQPAADDDFFNRDIETEIVIQVTFHGLTEREVAAFGSYVREGRLGVLKTYAAEDRGGTYHGWSMQVPEFAEIRQALQKKEIGKTAVTGKFKDLAALEKFAGLGPTAPSADAAFAAMEKFEVQHPDLCSRTRKQTQFLGAVGGGSIDNFTKFVFVPAVRDAKDEVAGKDSAIQQLIQTVVARKVDARDDVQVLKREFSEKMQKVYCASNLTELPDLAKGINGLLTAYAPGAELTMRFEDAKVPELRLPGVIPTLIEDGFGGTISNKGHGLQRALIICLLHYLEALVPEKTDGSGDTAGEAEGDRPEIIFAIEEPELYLHPSRCRYLAHLLQQLASTATQRMQVLYVTQSPFFVALRRFEQVRMVRKGEVPGVLAKQSLFSRYTPAEAAQHQAEVNAAPDRTKYTAESFMARAGAVMSTALNEGFFAEAVVVAEGATEVGMFNELAAIMHERKHLTKRWEELGVVVVPALGKGNLDRPAIIFKGLGIPTYIVWDADADKSESSSITANLRLQRLVGINSPVEKPATQQGNMFAVFATNIEDECKAALGSESFFYIRDEAAASIGYDSDKKDATKSVEGAAAFIRLVYDKHAKTLPALEEIVKRVTALALGTVTASAAASA